MSSTAARTTPHDAGRPTPPLGVVAAAVALVAYFGTLHGLIVHRFASPFAPWLALAMIAAPWVVALGASKRRAKAIVVATIVVAAAIGVIGTLGARSSGVGARSWAGGVAALAAHVDVLLFVENGVFLVALCAVFANSLRGPGEALVTRLARVARRGDMPPAVVRYTRTVTLAWAIFFAAAALVSALLFATRSRASWSAFVNLLLWPSTGAMFALEYAVRLRVLRDVSHLPMAAAIDAFRRRDRIAPSDARGTPQ